jgi:hypothetical protein
MDETALKAQLAAWVSQDGGPTDAFRFAEEHLDTLGSLDPELRDTLFYEALDGWIEAGRLTPEQLLHLVRRLVSPAFLFRGIGEPCGADVFRRTFSSLILDAIVRHLNGLEGGHTARIESVAEAMERYTMGELDLRGYVVPGGWAHAPAHAADVLASLAASPHLSGAWSERLLALVKAWLLKTPAVYTHQEDKRLARVVRNLCLHRTVDPRPWIEGLIEACPGSFSDMEAYARRTNLMNFLRALFFYLRSEPSHPQFEAFVEVQVRKLMRIP